MTAEQMNTSTGAPPSSSNMYSGDHVTPQQQQQSMMMQQQSMMMQQQQAGHMPTSIQSIANTNWRGAITRDQRQDLISQIYHELLRATGEPPGPTLWMKSSSYELKLFNESNDKDTYMSKISRRLYLLSQRRTILNMIQQSQEQKQQQLHQQQQMRMGGMGAILPQQSGGVGSLIQGNAMQGNAMHPQQMGMMQSNMNMGSSQQGFGSMANFGTPAISTNMQQSSRDEANVYWAEHAKLKARYWDMCVSVYKQFRWYIETGENDESGKLKRMLQFVHGVVDYLAEDSSKVPAKPLSEIQRAESYIHKYVIPYINKLNECERKAPFQYTDIPGPENSADLTYPSRPQATVTDVCPPVNPMDTQFLHSASFTMSPSSTIPTDTGELSFGDELDFQDLTSLDSLMNLDASTPGGKHQTLLLGGNPLNLNDTPEAASPPDDNTQQQFSLAKS